MLKQLWRWLQSWVQQWQQRWTHKPSPPTCPQPTTPPTPTRSDLEYETLFFQLLEAVVEKPSRGYVQGWLIANRVKESELLTWFERFGERQRSQTLGDTTLVKRLRTLGQVGYGKLSSEALRLANHLLPETLPPRRPVTTSGPAFRQTSPPSTSPVRPVTATPQSPTPSLPASLPLPVPTDLFPEIDTSDWDAKTWYTVSVEAYKASRPDIALVCCQMSIRLDPNFAYPHNGLGNLYSDLGAYEQAIAAFETAIDLNPNFAHPHNGLGNLYMGLGAYEQAVASFKTAIHLDPNVAAFHNGLGNLYFDLGAYEQAIASFETAIRLAPNVADTYNGLGHVYSDLGAYEQAIAAFETAIDLNPNFAHPHNGLGNLYMGLGAYEQAIAAFETAIDLNPNFAHPHNGLGHVYSDLGAYEQAIAAFEAAIHLDPNFAYPHSGLGSLYFDLGAYEQAIAFFDQALRLDRTYWKLWANRSFAVKASNGLGKRASSLFPEMQSPVLEQRGYEGAVGTLQEGLRYVPTGQEGEGRLHHQLGLAHYAQAQIPFQPHNSIHLQQQAIDQYHQALDIFQPERFGEIHLEVLQDLIFPLQDLGQIQEADGVHQKGVELLQCLLTEAEGNPSRIRQLEQKFARFRAMAISTLVQQGAILAAWEAAEQHKNALLTWLLSAWSGSVPTARYAQAQELLAPTTAIVYWHLSPVAVTTFVLKFGQDSPIALPNPTTTASQTIAQSRGLDQWIRTWNEEYNDYRDQKGVDNRASHGWRNNLSQRFEELRQSLNLAAVEAELEGITHIILMPHQDLHRFPLHTLFQGDYICTYLPSVQVGLNLQARAKPFPSLPDLALLSVENPRATVKGEKEQKKISLPLPFAEVEAEVICQVFPRHTRYEADSATEATVLTALQQNHQVFHFTGHGFYDFETPTRSTLYLTGEDRLTLAQLLPLDLSRYNLICLSACETAMTGTQTITTEYVGFVSGFLGCGVSWVLSTLWTVNSAASALLMMDFYDRLAAAIPPPLALRQSQEWLRQSSREDLACWYQQQRDRSGLSPKVRNFLQRQLGNLSTLGPYPYADPYHWAAFTLSGR